MDEYTFSDLAADLWERLRGWLPLSAYIALFSAAFLGLSSLLSGVAGLNTLLTLVFVLTAMLAGGVGVIEVVAQSERSRLLAFAAAAYGIIAVILTVANAMSGAFVK